MINNPFIIYGYISPGFFCNRNKELKALISAIENNRNVTLQSMRRLGKTSLLHHLFYHLQSKKSFRTIYLDLQFTSRLEDLLDLLANAVYSNLLSKQKKLVKDFFGIFRTIKPSLTFDTKSGNPAIELGIQSEHQAKMTADDIFNYLHEYSNKYKIVIAFDEFQQIVNYPEKNIEAYLRSKIQNLPYISFIFSGSSKHLMTEMFFSVKKPFYQSTEVMNLDKLFKNEFTNFISEKFSSGKKEITTENIHYILSKCFDYTYYVQFLCNKLYSSEHKRITKEHIDLAILDILNENENTYYSYKNLLTDYQWKLTRAIAKEGIVEKPTSGDFIAKYSLKAVSSVKSAINSLLEKEILYREKNAYFVYDVFFWRWLEMGKF